jgi:hypothetical protein
MAEPFSVVVQNNRVHIPQELSKRLSWLSGTDVITCWVLIVDHGRYRVYTKGQIDARPSIQQLLDSQSEEIGEADDYSIESGESAIVRFRLRQTQVSPKGGPGWRLSLPFDLLPHGATVNGQTVYLLISQGFLEVWTPECIAERLRKLSV